jgi:hypothetical protein
MKGVLWKRKGVYRFIVMPFLDTKKPLFSKNDMQSVKTCLVCFWDVLLFLILKRNIFSGYNSSWVSLGVLSCDLK